MSKKYEELNNDTIVRLEKENKLLRDKLAEAEKLLMSAANYGLGIQQARKYFGQDCDWMINGVDPEGYEDLEIYEKSETYRCKCSLVNK